MREACQDEAEALIRTGQLHSDHFDAFVRNRQSVKEAEQKVRCGYDLKEMHTCATWVFSRQPSVITGRALRATEQRLDFGGMDVGWV